MERQKRSINFMNWPEICTKLEYIISIYVALTVALNLLNTIGRISFVAWFMQPDFWGASLLIILLLHEGLFFSNKENLKLSKIRPYTVGLIAAGIVSTCNVPLIVLLLLVVGYFLITGYQSKFGLKECTLAAMVAFVGIEVYSIAMLMVSESTELKGFFGSTWPDVLFALCVIIYCVVNKEGEQLVIDEDVAEKAEEKSVDESNKHEEASDNLGEASDKHEEKTNIIEEKSDKFEKETSKFEEKSDKPEKRKKITEKLTKIANSVSGWLQTNSGLIASCLGGGLCVLAVGVFAFYGVSVYVGAKKIANSEEEVYLLQHCEDTSLVLSMEKNAKNDTYTVVFREYTGANDQKIQLHDRGDGTYQLVFVESDYALEVTKEKKKYVLGLNSRSDSAQQSWTKQEVSGQKTYKFLCSYSVPLSYQKLKQAKGVPTVAVKTDNGGYEFFTLERTVSDELVTQMVQEYGEEMKPLLLRETLIGSLGDWFVVVLLAMITVLGVIIYSHKMVGVKPAVLYAVFFVFLAAYASGWAIVLFLLAWGFLCLGGYLRRQGIQRAEEAEQFDVEMPETFKAGMLLSFTMAVMVIFPVLNRIMETGVFFLLIPFVLWGIRVAKGGFKNIARYISWEEIVWLGLFFLFVAAVILRLTGVWSAGNHQTGEYAVVASVVILYPVLKPLAGWHRECLRMPVFIGIWTLTLYFIDKALFPGALLLFGKEQDTLNYINMTAFLVILMASGLYLYEEDSKMRPVYVAGVAVPALVAAVNGAWGTVFMVFVMFIIHSVTIVPVAEVMKRLQQLFFGLALFFCGMPLLVKFCGFLHVEGLEYHLECGVSGVLFLCLPGAYVFRRWKRIPAEIDLREIKLTRLQKGCRTFLTASAALLVPVVLLSLVDGRLRAANMEVSNLIQLFAGNKWEEMSSNLFIVPALSLLEHMNEMLIQMGRENIIAVFYQMYGGPGATVTLVVVALLCRRLYFMARGKGLTDDLVVWLAVGCLGALFCLPVTVYMLPVYLMSVFMAMYVEETGKAG